MAGPFVAAQERAQRFLPSLRPHIKQIYHLFDIMPHLVYIKYKFQQCF